MEGMSGWFWKETTVYLETEVLQLSPLSLVTATILMRKKRSFSGLPSSVRGGKVGVRDLHPLLQCRLDWHVPSMQEKEVGFQPKQAKCRSVAGYIDFFHLVFSRLF